MYTVKRLEAGEVYAEIELSETKTLQRKVNTITYAVVNENGNVVATQSFNGKWIDVLHTRKKDAVSEAKWMNANNPETKERTI